VFEVASAAPGAECPAPPDDRLAILELRRVGRERRGGLDAETEDSRDTTATSVDSSAPTTLAARLLTGRHDTCALETRARLTKESSLMTQLIVRFVRNDEGQDLIEYVLIGALVTIAVVAGATALGTSLNSWYQNMATWVSQQTTV
jgi:pilus assembly protein Flp/PilA